VLRELEQPVAAAVGLKVFEDLSPASVNYTLGDISVSGLTTAQIKALLTDKQEEIITFAIAVLTDQEATDQQEEYPEGEEQDPSQPGEVLGLGVGFGIKHAILFNFFANRSSAELRAYLKNRRIPHQAKFAKALRRIFEEVQSRSKL